MMKKLMVLIVAMVALVGPAQGAGAAASGYRWEQHDCWIGGYHYGSRTTIRYSSGVYTVTQVKYTTSPATWAHRAEWRTKSDNVVRFAMGGTSATRDDVPTSHTFYPTATYNASNLLFRVYDGASGVYCSDDTPVVGSGS